MDCRFCHNTVEQGAHAAIPSTETCMTCHASLSLPQSVPLAAVRMSWEMDKPITWVRVHQLPDYVFFDHRVHFAAGVGCVSCHGRVDEMAVVSQAEPLSMAWCLACHRDATPNLRPFSKITDLTYDPQNAGYDPNQDPKRKRKVEPPLHCSGCHR